MKKTSRTAALIGSAGLVLMAVSAPPALADPAAGDYRQLAAVGSDTTQDVMNGLADVLTDSKGNKIIASYDAFGSAKIQTKPTSNCQMDRPAGSGAGRTALVNSLTDGQATKGCLDFSRSSSLSTSAVSVGGGFAYIPFAVDAVTYATTKDSVLPANLTKAQLTAIYKCQPVTGVPTDVQPLLPQSGSGTRGFWLGQLGLTENDVKASTCVKDKLADGSDVQEHNGTVLTNPKQIVPFSIAQYLAQGAGISGLTDKRGIARLNQIEGSEPVVGGHLNASFPISRSVYNVVPVDRLSDKLVWTVFATSKSLICQRGDVIQKYGFGLAADCGDLTHLTQGASPVPSGVTLPASSTTLGVSAASVRYGAGALVTVRVSSTDPSVTPTGVATVKDGAATLGNVTISGGTGTLRLPVTLRVGGHRLTASYAGSQWLAASDSSAVTLTVTKATSATSAKLAAATVRRSRTTKVTVTVTGSTAAPTGTVELREGRKLIARGTVTGTGAKRVVVLNVKNLKVGKHTLVARYLGNAVVAGSTARPVVLTVK